MGRYPQAGLVPISHTRDTAGPMAVAMADVELMDRVVTSSGAIPAAELRGVRLGLVPDFLANLDGDTRSASTRRWRSCAQAGVTVVDVAMPRLQELNGNVAFPVALYEAYDDMVAYLRSAGTGITIQQLAAGLRART
jgi:mandelamide amidase